MSSNQGSSSSNQNDNNINNIDDNGNKGESNKKQQQLQSNQTQKESSIPQLGALEEDDEFEEFAAEDWNETEEDQETHLWEDNWDDEDIEDDFSKQLRAEITKATNAPQPMRY